MSTFIEGDLQITFDDIVPVRKFDDGRSHCMKAVDFIVELSDRYLFIEFKDPQDPAVPDPEGGAYLQRFKRGQLDKSLQYKYRDSFLYEWAAGRADKPVYYLVLVALDTLASPLLTQRQKALEQKLPLRGPQGQSWSRPIVNGCAVFNMESWNSRFPKYQVARRSSLREAVP